MGNLTREEKLRRREEAKKKERRQLILTGLGIGLAVVLIAVVAVISNAQGSASKNLTVALAEDGSLRVAKSDLGSYFNYIDWGGPEELILYPSGGQVDAAFDTCEECYLEGSVHFTRSRNSMVCSVCGTVETLDEFGHQEWGGCRPITVPAAARLDTDDTVIISGEALEYLADMLHHWSEGDMSVTFADFAL